MVPDWQRSTSPYPWPQSGRPDRSRWSSSDPRVFRVVSATKDYRGSEKVPPRIDSSTRGNTESFGSAATQRPRDVQRLPNLGRMVAPLGRLSKQGGVGESQDSPGARAESIARMQKQICRPRARRGSDGMPISSDSAPSRSDTHGRGVGRPHHDESGSPFRMPLTRVGRETKDGAPLDPDRTTSGGCRGNRRRNCNDG